jgi:hypothetical protein
MFMRNILILCVVVAVLTGCQSHDVNIFGETPDQRVADAVNNLKHDLTSPDFGYKFLYQPEETSGSFLILANFNEDNTVYLQTDLGAENGKYYTDTITWRIDNSLGLEVIFENYSFFSYLFEQDQATFGAEYEFIYVNKTPDDDLVFKSKTDAASPTIITMVPAGANDSQLLGRSLSNKISTLSEDLGKFSSSLSLTYTDKDLIFYMSNDALKRMMTISAASKKSDISVQADVNVTTGYYLVGDSLVFQTPITGTFFGNSVQLKGLSLKDLGQTSMNVCSGAIDVHTISGKTSAGDDVVLQTTLVDLSGTSFTQSSFLYSPVYRIFQNGESVEAQLTADLTGVNSMQLYYNYDLGNSKFFAMGFRLVNSDGSATFALREFTPELIGNNIIFHFAPNVSIFGASNPDADINNVNIYLNALNQGNKAYVYKISEGVYEFYNPCSKYSFIFYAAN